MNFSLSKLEAKDYIESEINEELKIAEDVEKILALSEDEYKKSFSSYVPFKIWNKDKSGAFKASWEVENIKYVFTASKYSPHVYRASDIGTEFDIKGSFQTIMFSGGGSYGITGTGNVNVVFATIAKVFEKYLQIVKPLAFNFTASESSRKKVYHILCIQLERNNRDYVYVNKTTGKEQGFYVIVQRKILDKVKNQ